MMLKHYLNLLLSSLDLSDHIIQNNYNVVKYPPLGQFHEVYIFHLL